MYTKTILSTLILCLPLAFLVQKTPETLTLERNKNIHEISKIENNNSQSITNFPSSIQNIVEIKSCWEKEDLASQRRYCSSSLKTIEEF